MIKTLTIACLAGATMMTAAVAGTPVSAKNAKAPVAPAPAPACADGISYNNLGLDWTHSWVDGSSDVDGIDLNVEKTIIDKLYVHGSVSWADGVTDEWGFLAGLGYGIPLVKNIDFVTEAGALFSEDNYEAFYVFPHLRGKWGCFELHAGAKFICPEGGDDNFWEAHVDGYYQVASHLDLHVGGIFSDDVQTLRAGVRFKF